MIYRVWIWECEMANMMWSLVFVWCENKNVICKFDMVNMVWIWKCNMLNMGWIWKCDRVNMGWLWKCDRVNMGWLWICDRVNMGWLWICDRVNMGWIWKCDMVNMGWLWKCDMVNMGYRDISPAVRVFANGPGDLDSIPGRVIPKTLKMELDTTLLNTQHYNVRSKGKVEQSRELNSALPYTLV